MGASVDRVREAFDAVRSSGRNDVWISLRDEEDVLRDAHEVDIRVASEGPLALGGLVCAIKDNIDVAGVPTTAGCPDYSYIPRGSSVAVQRLREAGCVVIGKTNMDQFATGLVGTRSPYGVVADVDRPDRIAGGSSSGSAIAVALGLVDFALGTDTAGSGRVPAAYAGIVGYKPTLGLIPTTGVVPACADYDAVSIFAARAEMAAAVGRALIGPDAGDPRSRTWQPDTPLAAPAHPTVAVPREADLTSLSGAYRASFESTTTRLAEMGADLREVNIEEFLEVARLMYEGSLVAQRYVAFGAFLEGRPPSADPVVSSIVLESKQRSAVGYAEDLDSIARAAQRAAELFASSNALMLPTVPFQPTIEDVQADPFGVNIALGTFTNFCNLLDLAAVSVPEVAALPDRFGVTFTVPAFADQVALDLAGRLTGDPVNTQVAQIGVPIGVFGAHMSGHPLNYELVQLGARRVESTRTSSAYRLVELDGSNTKPGLARVGPERGREIAGELWNIAPGALGRFTAALDFPMSLGPIELHDGRWVTGFGCTVEAWKRGTDISDHGGWEPYLRSLGA